ncbi:hypothetical protein BCR44DRAFT_80831 [Catenaria anguillulae PL171]|uniref:CCR4-NOT transcription complex subunit 11 n=1 Tax=Catenaria anguillulae PL171 TaxID=765915 RepID=A0A1Y2HJF4_9FUNG|nr:hypothetical protein BCR44DRAFT_80831 [Catenaria anguillulae PL171]
MSDSRVGTRPHSRAGSSAGGPRGGPHSGGGRPPSSRANSRRASPTPAPPPLPPPPPPASTAAAAGSETDEDWDLANVTDDEAEDGSQTPLGGRGVSSRGAVRSGSTSELQMSSSVSSLPPVERSNTAGGTGPASRRSGVNMGAGEIANTGETDPVHFPPGTLAALSALPLGEAWRLVRARVALDVNSIDAWKLYAACVELLDVVKDVGAPLPTRLLATFLLYALYVDPSLPIPPSVILGSDDLSSITSDPSSPSDADPISFFALARMPSDLPLLSGIAPELPTSASSHLSKFPTTIRLAMAVACAHPFLGILLHIARHAHTNAEQLLAKLLLVSPRADRPAPSPSSSTRSSNASTATTPFPLLVRDPEFLAKTAVHLATFSDALSGYADPKVAQFADAILKVLEEYVGAMDVYLTGLVPGLVAMDQTGWRYSTSDLTGGANDTTSTLTDSPSSSPTIRSSSTPKFASPLPAAFLDPTCSSPRDQDSPPSPLLPPDTAAALADALHLASTTPMATLPVTLPARIPASMLANVSLFQGLITYSADVAKAVLPRVHPIEAIAEDVLLQISAPVRVTHLDLLHELWEAGVLSKRHLPVFVSRVIGLALGAASPRTVQLAAKFLSTHLKDLPPNSLVEVRNFCADYLMFKDCADLFAQVSQMAASPSSSTSSSAPSYAAVKPPGTQARAPADRSPSTGSSARGKRRNRRV